MHYDNIKEWDFRKKYSIPTRIEQLSLGCRSAKNSLKEWQMHLEGKYYQSQKDTYSKDIIKANIKYFEEMVLLYNQKIKALK